MNGERNAFYIPIDQFDKNGFIPSLVTEGRYGHAPLDGGQDGTPWYWGTTYEAAKAVAAKANVDNGLSEDDVATIIASSMAAPAPRGSSMITITCYYADGDTITTRFNGTPDDARSYFVGQSFNIGSVEDNTQKCVSVTVHDEPVATIEPKSKGNVFARANGMTTEQYTAWLADQNEEA
jgi:hypothetical protein